MRIAYNSGRNRHCPKSGSGTARRAYLASSGQLDPFAVSSGNGRYLRIPAEDPRRLRIRLRPLVADPIGHEVRF
jgi:hypothetical protein